MPLLRRVAGETYVPGADAVVPESDVVICVVYGRSQERMPDCLPVVLPAGIEQMVVVVVLSGHSVGDVVGAVVINGSALVAGAEELQLGRA